MVRQYGGHLMSARHIILYRGSSTPVDELEAMKKYFLATPTRLDIDYGDLVIGRYSVLPFYREQERDVMHVGAGLINTYAEHKYAADLGLWIKDLEGDTPQTWVSGNFADLPDDKMFVLKGETNSKKFLWDTHMFAGGKDEVGAVLGRLLDDSLISEQTIYVREYVPLVTYIQGLHGLPITKEFRVFVYDKCVVEAGFYWASHAVDIEDSGKKIPSPREIPIDWLNSVIERIGTKIPFYAVDVAQDQTGKWWVIDLNDGQMAGLSMIDPDIFYSKLKCLLP
jgi:hypothetical protein